MGKLDIRIVPPSATVYRGESLRIRCISYGIHQSHGQLGYSWTKNGILFKSNSKSEMWEDLYPYGSILKISSVQVKIYLKLIINCITIEFIIALIFLSEYIEISKLHMYIVK